MLAHTYCLAHLPYHHRDPVDRLLVAQALEENLAQRRWHVVRDRAVKPTLSD
jgi:PIN domain nuclease of toxin-antitoxin system